MKTFKIFILSSIFLTIVFSCDVLEIKPDVKISDEDVFEDVNYARANLVNVYSRMPYQPFPPSYYGINLNRLSDEITLADRSVPSLSGAGGSGWWDYTLMRDMNVFIERLRESETIRESDKSQMEGEMRMLRAFVYFEMQMRWGGVPLVDVVIDPYGEINEKYTKRSTEEAIADFIDTELAAAAGMLTDNPAPLALVNKWTALALKARANLWAASIAKYGSVQLNGLVGIPSTRANEFFTKASETANAIIQSGNYSLYNKNPDNKSENYRRIFIDEENSEVIFELVYDGINIAHSFDAFNTLVQHSYRGTLSNPLLEFILGYENIDGSMDQPQFGTNHLYNDGREPFLKKDPRLFGSVFFEGENWLGTTVETYEGIDPNDPPDPSTILNNVNSFYEGRRQAGQDSRNGAQGQNATKSGFAQKKYIDEKKFLEDNESSTNWIIFRLAEMYLIRAEAEFELGHRKEAAEALNPTRERAGISLVDENTITLDRVRTERRSEMAFEELRYWDLRRWRIAESVLSGFFHGLRIIYHAPSGKYYFLEMEAETSTRDFETKYYYNVIGASRISNNPLLVENPKYD